MRRSRTPCAKGLRSSRPATSWSRQRRPGSSQPQPEQVLKSPAARPWTSHLACCTLSALMESCALPIARSIMTTQSAIDAAGEPLTPRPPSFPLEDPCEDLARLGEALKLRNEDVLSLT